jgi:MFS family permease
MDISDNMSDVAKTFGKDGGMRSFMLVWSGQFVSILGSTMTFFGLAIWAWLMTGQATALALVGFFSFGPTILLSPVAGALVDRWDRKTTMILSDLASGLGTATILMLYSTGALAIWHLYIVCAITGAFGAFQFPAYSAAITMMVEKRHYGRANAMLGMADSGSSIIAPVLAAALLIPIGIVGIMIIDIVTFAYAIAVILFVRIPNPPPSEDGRKGAGSIWKESLYGFKYIRERRGLMGLLMFFLAFNLIATMGHVLMTPMILARTGSDSVALGTVQSMFGLGGVIGGIIVAVWGGPKYRVGGIIMGIAGSCLFGTVLMGLGQSLAMWATAAFMISVFSPVVGASSQSIWQSKVAPDLQGRVFASRRMLAQICIPVSMLMAGPLADRIFEPGMAPGGSLASVFGGVVGTGPGAGMGLMLLISGLLCLVVCAAAYASPTIRNLESSLPDHDVTVATPAAA